VQTKHICKFSKLVCHTPISPPKVGWNGYMKFFNWSAFLLLDSSSAADDSPMLKHHSPFMIIKDSCVGLLYHYE